MSQHSPRASAALGFALLLLLTSGASAPAGAEVYQWRDSSGHLHFGDRPPATVDYQLFEPSGAIADNAAPASGNRDETPTQQAGADAAAACTKARETLERYRSADRLVETTDSGEERKLSETEREEIIAMQQGLVDRACG
jgi:hypothetical protein